MGDFKEFKITWNLPKFSRYDFEILPSKILYLTKAIESENDMLFSKVSLI